MKLDENMKSTDELAERVSQLKKEIKAGALFIYDPGSGKVIAGDSIASVHPNEDGAIQIDLAPDWWMAFHGFNGGIGACTPANVCEVDGDNPEIRARVELMRELVAARQITILDPTSGYLIPSEWIEDVSANGPAIQLTLDRMWHGEREDCLRDSAEDDDFSTAETEE